ncbi:hypothetical protein HZS_7745 [Henneguya salminicola]|nr:hypothetical protein HZS_7745 [Henneguya salminicola]
MTLLAGLLFSCLFPYILFLNPKSNSSFAKTALLDLSSFFPASEGNFPLMEGGDHEFGTAVGISSLLVL